MSNPLRLAALFAVWFVTTLGWLLLAAVTSSRATDQESALTARVDELWGRTLEQPAPSFVAAWTETEDRTEVHTDANGRESVRVLRVPVERTVALSPSSTDLTVDVREDIRRKGLMWFPLYDLDLRGRWQVTWSGDRPVRLDVHWAFPDPAGFYDGFRVVVDGVEAAHTVVGDSAHHNLDVTPGQTVVVEVAFRTRGAGAWSYRPTQGVGEVRDLDLTLTTDFADIDYPAGALSPGRREERGEGWALAWTFERLVSGKSMGVIVPCPIQPGELASRLTLSAPISLGLFMLWIHVLGVLRSIDVHPINHAFLAAAFFSFHMLFGYTADHLPTEEAFALSSVVSVLLVVTYLMRVVSPRFAVVQAGGAQLVYLVGFAAAHFLDGMTGLTLTVIGVATLFGLMQLTAHIRWGHDATPRMTSPEAA